MARIERVSSSRKEHKCSKCGNTIEVGQPYLKATPYRRPTIYRCIKCGLKSYETSGSEYVKEVGSIVEDWQESYGIRDGVAEEIASTLEDLRDQQQDSLDNMPEQLQDGDTGMMLQGRIDSLETAIDELENVSWEDCEIDAKDEVLEEIGEYDPDSDEWGSEEDYQEELEDRIRELTEEKYSELIDEALSNIEY